MAENKLSVEEYLHRIEDEKMRKDSFALLKLMKKVTGLDAQMWYGHVIGFGIRYYYGSRGKVDAPLTGFSLSQQNLTIYIKGAGFDQHTELLNKLGKHTEGKGFLWIKRLSDVHIPTLKALIEKSLMVQEE